MQIRSKPLQVYSIRIVYGKPLRALHCPLFMATRVGQRAVSSVSRHWKLLSILILIVVGLASVCSYLVSRKPANYTQLLFQSLALRSQRVQSPTIGSSARYSSTTTEMDSRRTMNLLFKNATVRLIGSSGNLVATAQTDSSGDYSHDAHTTRRLQAPSCGLSGLRELMASGR